MKTRTTHQTSTSDLVINTGENTMLNTTKKLIAASVFTALTAGSAFHAQADDMWIAISPYQDQSVLKQHAITLLDFALSNAKGGDVVRFMDAYSGTVLAKISVPNKRSYVGNKKALKKLNIEAIKFLKQFVLAPPTKPIPSVKGTANAPLVLEKVASTRPSQAVDVLIVASPFQDVIGQDVFSMKRGFIPNDASLMAPPSKNVYSVKHKTQYLNNVRVHWVYGGHVRFENNQQSHFLKRFWSLFTSLQGGSLVSYGTDLGATLESIKYHAAPLDSGYKLNSVGKPAMVRYYERLKFQKPKTVSASAAKPAKLTRKQLAKASDVSVGLSWDCATCDLDLHVRPAPSDKVLNFKQRVTEKGEHLKSIETSTMQATETVELTGSVDVKKMEIAAHFYSGHAPKGVRGNVDLSVNGQAFRKPFYIPATYGAPAVHVKTSLKSAQAAMPQTAVIDPMSVVSL